MFQKKENISFSNLESFFDKNTIFKDYINNFENLFNYYEYDYKNLSEIIKHKQDHNINKNIRKKIVQILAKYNYKFNNSKYVQNNIEDLNNEKSFVVITGQQAGLLTGPLYTIYKAISVILLSKKLSSLYKLNVIPVFWVASEDHDINEINHINYLKKNTEFTKIIAKTKYINSRSIYDIEWENLDFVNLLSDNLQESEFKNSLIYNLPTKEKNASKFFVRILSNLFKEYGLLIIEPDYLRPLFSDINFKYYENRHIINKIFKENNSKLIKSGYNTTIDFTDALRLFYINAKQRKRIYESENNFTTKNKSFSINKGDLKKKLKENPEDFSTDVLLRPIYQDSIFPNLAYVAGPGEISYFAQLKTIYKLFNIKMPMIYPRMSITLIEKKNQNIMKKLNISLSKLFKIDYKLDFNYNLNKNITNEFKTQIENATIFITNKAQENGKTVKESISSSLRKIITESNKLESKYIKAIKNLNQINEKHLNYLKNSLTPKLHLQERIFNIFQYINLYGFSIIDNIIKTASIDKFKHQVLYFE